MGERVDGEDAADGVFWFGENGTAAANAGVVEEDGWVAVGGADGGGEGFDALGGGYVTFVEVHVWC